MEVGKEEKISRSQPVEKVGAAAESPQLAPSVIRSGNTPATAKREAFSLVDDTILPSPEEGATIRPRGQTRPAPVRVFKETIKGGRFVPRWLKNIPAAVVAAVLLALIVYMVWRATH